MMKLILSLNLIWTLSSTDPGVQRKNNLQCFTCDDRSSAVCKKKVQCAGTEDRCVRGT
eukprot:superscaffoldBa00006370_g21449